MSATMTFREVEALAAETLGRVPYSRMWNVLMTRVRAGQEINTPIMVAFIAGSVGMTPYKAAEMIALAQRLGRAA